MDDMTAASRTGSATVPRLAVDRCAAALKRGLLSFAVIATRQYFRCFPFRLGKELLWRRFAQAYLFWRRTPFRVRTEWGGLFECSGSDFIQRYILLFGVWEPCLTELMINRLRAGDVFIDVGANVGYFSILAARLVGPTGSVVAIEASPHICTLLRRNIALNGLTNIRVVQQAVADRAGRMTIEPGPADSLALTRTRWAAESPHVATIPADTLQALVTREEWSAARMIKIDIEGGEVNVFPSLLEGVDRLRRDVEIVAELSVDALGDCGERARSLFSRFATAGFRPYAIENSYAYDSYFDRARPAAPRRLTEIPELQTDVLFSRL